MQETTLISYKLNFFYKFVVEE